MAQFFKVLTGGKSQNLQGEGNDRINILLIGIGGKGHPGGTLADTIMILSIKPKEKAVAFLSIPRDLYVKIPYQQTYGKINSAHSYGENNPKLGGPKVLSKAVSEVTGLPIHYYLRGDFVGFQKLVDSFKGVTVDVPNDIYDSKYPDERMKGYSTFKLKKGVQTLNGATALKYARSRESTSDFDRAKRQQQLLLAIKDKAMNLGILANPKKVVDVVNILGDHIRTDMNIEELARLADVGKNMDSSKMKQVVLDTSPGGALVSSSGSAGYILKPRAGDYSEIQSIAKNIFKNSSKTTDSTEQSTIQVRNATGQSGYATEVSQYLNKIGYTSSIYTETVTPIAQTIIYDYTNGKKPNTAKYLKDHFNAAVIKKTSSGSTSSEEDFVLTLGTDYLSLIRKNVN